jgi:hypothetical protein
MPAKSRFVIMVVMAALLLSGISGAAMAAKGGKGGGGTGGGGTHGGKGGGGSGTLTLVVLNSADGVAHYGGDVTFTVSTTATPRPMVEATCSQTGTLVYSHSAGFFPEYLWPDAQIFQLSSGAWTGGAADCTAKLYMSDGNGGFSTLTTIGFQVAA